jgi:DNA modification methylase
VLDPFAGSGATIEACHELKLSCTAIEQDAGAFGIAVKRTQSLAAFDQALF